MALADDIDDYVIALYKDVESDADMMKYTYDTNEKSEFVKTVDRQAVGSYYINVFGVDLKKMGEPKKIGNKVLSIKMGRVDDLIKSVLKHSINNGAMEHIYAFPYKNSTVLGAFDIIEKLSNEKKTFYYSVLNNKLHASFARYNYLANKLDFSNDFGDHSYMYVKIISLVKPFGFFKE